MQILYIIGNGFDLNLGLKTNYNHFYEYYNTVKSDNEIVKKLKGFFNKYGNTYSKEDIIKATKKYVNYYNSNLTYMQLLKYFIWKLKDNGEEISELASYLDNLDNEDVINNDDWLTNLI